MDYMIMIICLVIAIICAGKDKRNIANPALAFMGIWLLTIYLSKLRLYGLLDVSNDIYNVLINGYYSFFIGYLVARLYSISPVRFRISKKISKGNNSTIRYSFIYILAIVCIIYFIPNTLVAGKSLLSGTSLGNIRVIAQNSTGSSSIMNMIYNLVVLPSATALEVIAVADFWVGKKGKKLFYLNLVVILMRCVSDGGRTPLFNFAIYMIVGYVVLPKTDKMFVYRYIKKKKKLLYLYGGIGICLLMIMTFSRASRSELESVLRQLYFYFSMSPVLFSRWKSIVDSVDINTYGLTSLNGVFFTGMYLLRNMFGLPYPELLMNSYNLISQTDSIWQTIAQGGIHANAYVSAYWFFYVDGRKFGIILGMFLYGLVVSNTFFNLNKEFNIVRYSVYLLLYQGLFFSFIRFPFAKMYYVLGLVIIILFAFKRSERKERND